MPALEKSFSVQRQPFLPACCDSLKLPHDIEMDSEKYISEIPVLDWSWIPVLILMKTASQGELVWNGIIVSVN
jgi:hypothetical protein